MYKINGIGFTNNPDALDNYKKLLAKNYERADLFSNISKMYVAYCKKIGLYDIIASKRIDILKESNFKLFELVEEKIDSETSIALFACISINNNNCIHVPEILFENDNFCGLTESEIYLKIIDFIETTYSSEKVEEYSFQFSIGYEKLKTALEYKNYELEQTDEEEISRLMIKKSNKKEEVNEGCNNTRQRKKFNK